MEEEIQVILLGFEEIEKRRFVDRALIWIWGFFRRRRRRRRHGKGNVGRLRERPHWSTVLRNQIDTENEQETDFFFFFSLNFLISYLVTERKGNGDDKGR